ncbi:hypothetical protein FJZ17_00510 [Candidatus Pacearchaeota archaeon]|nr:hypothetical protein [Candidatus Pacearchaeota archaeon]
MGKSTEPTNLLTRVINADPTAPSRIAEHPYFRERARRRFGYIRSLNTLPKVAPSRKRREPITIRAKVRRAVQETIKDMNTFYRDFDLVRNIAPGLNLRRLERLDAYRRMEQIAGRYDNPALQNKLDEAEAYLRTGR